MSKTRESIIILDNGEKKSIDECIKHLEPNSKTRVEQLEFLMGLSLDITDKLCDMIRFECNQSDEDSL